MEEGVRRKSGSVDKKGRGYNEVEYGFEVTGELNDEFQHVKEVEESKLIVERTARSVKDSLPRGIKNINVDFDTLSWEELGLSCIKSFTLYLLI